MEDYEMRFREFTSEKKYSEFLKKCGDKLHSTEETKILSTRYGPNGKETTNTIYKFSVYYWSAVNE